MTDEKLREKYQNVRWLLERWTLSRTATFSLLRQATRRGVSFANTFLFTNNLSPSRFISRQRERVRERKTEKKGKYLGGRGAASFRDRKQATPIFTLVEHIGLHVLHRVLRFESNEQRNKEDKKNVECDSQLDYIRWWDNYRLWEQSSRDIEFLRCLPWRYFSRSHPYEENEMELEKDI